MCQFWGRDVPFMAHESRVDYTQLV